MNRVFLLLRAFARQPIHRTAPRRQPGGWFVGWLVLAAFGLAACNAEPDVPPPTATPDRPPRIAFMSNRDGTFDVFLMDLDGRNVQNLTENEAQDGVPSYSQAARTFVFLTDRDLGTLGIYRMGEGGEAPAAMTTDPIPTTDQPQWSPNGEFIVYHAGEPNNLDIYLVDVGANTVQPLVMTAGNDQFWGWSSDGSRILFTSDEAGSPAIYVKEMPDGELIRLTDPTTGSAFPALSPDETKIVFASDRDDDVEIYLMDADGGNQVRLTEAAGFDGFPKWSPDGSRIAFVSFRDENAEIYAMNTGGGDLVNLTNIASEESVDGDFSWSPDGSKILFTTNRDGDDEVYVMNADGSNPQNLTGFPSVDIAPIWVP
jgi:Tol biopolymer transport system component